MTNPDSIASLTSTRQAILAALAKLKDQIDPKYPNANLDAANKRQVTPPGARLNHQESPHRSPWVIPMDKITESLKIHLPEYLKRDI